MVPQLREPCVCVCAADYLEEQGDFLLIPRHQELLGDRAKDGGIPVSIENTGLEDGGRYVLSYVLFRCVCTFEVVPYGFLFFYLVEVYLNCVLSLLLCRRFSPEFFQGCSVEETQLHSLQLYPLFTSESL